MSTDPLTAALLMLVGILAVLLLAAALAHIAEHVARHLPPHRQRVDALRAQHMRSLMRSLLRRP